MLSLYFPEPYTSRKNKTKFELDLSNYATKSDLNNATGIAALNFAKKIDLASFKSEIDKLDIGKFKTTPADLGKLSDAVKNGVVKKTVCDELIKKKLMLFGLLRLVI